MRDYDDYAGQVPFGAYQRGMIGERRFTKHLVHGARRNVQREMSVVEIRMSAVNCVKSVCI